VPFDVEFTIENTGKADLHLWEKEPVEITGANAALFSVLEPPGSLTIQPGGSAVFTIQFNLDAPGSKSAQIAVYSDDPYENPFEFTVSNTALPEIQVLQGATLIPSGSGSYDFGTVEYGQYRDVVFTIENIGKVNLDLTGAVPVSVSGDGFSVQPQLSSPVLPGLRSIFTVRVESTTPGAFGIDINCNSDIDEQSYAFDIYRNCELPLSSVNIAGGRLDNVTLKNCGSVVSWDLNTYGRLGNGTTTDSWTPVIVKYTPRLW
jgi:hypothetical protein